MDGAGLSRTLRSVVIPIVSPGIAATALICFIFSWNELLFARVLTVDRRADRAGLPHRLRHQPGPVPRQGLRRGRRRLAAGPHRRLRRAGQAGPGPVARRGQVGVTRPDRGHPVRARRPRRGPVLRPRRRCGVGIVHLGVGGFHRAHQAMYLDRLMERGQGPRLGDLRGRACCPATPACATRSSPQDGLYTLVEKAPDGTWTPRVIGVDRRVPARPGRPRARRRADGRPGRAHRLADRHRGRLQLRPGHRRVRRRRPGRRPRRRGRHGARAPSFGLVVEALARRRERGIAAVHGHVLRQHPGQRRTSRGAASPPSPSCATPSWPSGSAARCSFPNSMVDRITPVTTDDDRAAVAERYGVDDRWPVVCEPFTQWVLEDAFGDGRPPLEDAGVQVVDDVEPYELMKLRLLNASHQALAYVGHLAGYRLVHDVAPGPAVRRLPARLHGARGLADAAAGARHRPRRLPPRADRALLQRPGARHGRAAVRRELRPHPHLAAAGRAREPRGRPAGAARRPRSSRAGRATPRASTSRASRSRSSTGCASR